MNRQQIITELQKFFRIEELVCRHADARKSSLNLWMFFSTDDLHTLLIIRRDILKVPLIINDWFFGGKHTQRGLRCNICQLVRDATSANRNYMTSHGMAKGFDIVSARMSAAEMRRLIKLNEHLLPCPVRIEKDVTWLHIDTYDMANGKKINEF